MKPDKWYLLIIVTFLIWGTQHPFLKMLSDALSPFIINVLRFSITLIVLTPLVVAQKTIPSKKDFFKIAGLGVIGIACYGFFVIAGLQRLEYNQWLNHKVLCGTAQATVPELMFKKRS